MAKISDILAKATSKLKWVWASIADAVAPATSSILAKDAPTASTFGGSGVSLFEAKPWQKVETIVDSATKWLYNIGADFADKEEKYLSTPESDKSIIDKALYAVEKVPFTIWAWVDQAINAPTNTQKIEWVTNAAMWLLSLRPDVAAFQVWREVLLSQDMQKWIQSGIDTIMSYSDPTLKAMWVTDENLQSTKNIIYNIGALLLSWKVAPKVWWKVSSAVKKSGGSVAKQSTAWFMANATVQSAPDIIWQITNYLTNGWSEEDAISTLAPTILNTLWAIPLGKKSAPSKTPRTDKMNQIKIDAAKDTSVPDFNEFVAKENPTKEQIKTIENSKAQ